MSKLKSTVINLVKGLDLQLTKNFHSSEFDCKCKYDSCKETLIDLDHLVELQQLRDEIGPLTITSAYRCDKHNKDVGGSPNSTHTRGEATDLVSRNVSPKELADACEYFNGLGRYPNFTHIDSREIEPKDGVARWGKN